MDIRSPHQEGNSKNEISKIQNGINHSGQPKDRGKGSRKAKGRNWDCLKAMNGGLWDRALKGKKKTQDMVSVHVWGMQKQLRKKSSLVPKVVLGGRSRFKRNSNKKEEPTAVECAEKKLGRKKKKRRTMAKCWRTSVQERRKRAGKKGSGRMPEGAYLQGGPKSGATEKEEREAPKESREMRGRRNGDKSRKMWQKWGKEKLGNPVGHKETTASR